MDYSKVDSILDRWGRDVNLKLIKQYKDTEVRSFEYVDTKGSRFQIWLSKHDAESLTYVHVWDYKKRRRDFVVSAVDIYEYLNTALAIAKAWDS